MTAVTFSALTFHVLPVLRRTDIERCKCIRVEAATVYTAAVLESFQSHQCLPSASPPLWEVCNVAVDFCLNRRRFEMFAMPHTE